MSIDLKKNPNISEEARHDIDELRGKISDFKNLKVDEEKFRAYRLARGVYGQRQEGVQMVRIKLPYGRVTPDQLDVISDVSDKYAAKNLHLTTRQDIQIHYVKLENSPKVWEELEKVGVTLREACGNTVRNITASAKAGIDPNEPFDVSSYAHEHFRYFLRNPICQEMGRKFKMSFSSSEADDSAFAYMHDLGFIPQVRTKDGKEERGFTVYIGGGLGAQAVMAQKIYDFLPEDQIIPYTEAVIRVFDRYGERSKRHKARMKFLLKKLGLEEFQKLVDTERKAIKTKSYSADRNIIPEGSPSEAENPVEDPQNKEKYEAFLKTNVFEQKQKGYYGVYVRLPLGDMSTDNARVFADIVRKFASEDIRITVNQGYLLRFVKETDLPALHNALDKAGLGEPGFDSTADITACPGTDTCNLGIASSTGLAEELERVIREDYPELIYNNDIKIKISGCMNACGQHNIANIGFHGMSIKKGPNVMPAMQLLIGGKAGKGGRFADKVIKVPSKRAPQAFRVILEDYENNKSEGEYFNDYYDRKKAEEKLYFFNMLKPLTSLDEVSDLDFVDWGHDEKYVKAIGVGECAGAMVDLVQTLILETAEKFNFAEKALSKGSYADAIYQAYNTFVTGAKALLTTESINCNTHISIINDFDEHLVKAGKFDIPGNDFVSYVLRIQENEPGEEFANAYVKDAKQFLEKVQEYRSQEEVSEVK